MANRTSRRAGALLLAAAVTAGSISGFPASASAAGENLLTNPGFEDGTSGWNFGESGAGVGNNNPHSDKNQMYLDGGEGQFTVSQSVTATADGIYEASAWAACGGENGTFGIRKADGTELKEVTLESGGYKEYTISDVELASGDVVEVYMTSGTEWVNADDFSFVCTEETEDTSKYTFEGNMLKNTEFDNGTENWNISGGNAGTADNNGYPSGDTHYWLDPGVTMEQTVTVPYTGTYRASTWVSASGNNGMFGVKDAEGNVLASAEIASQQAYTQYELEFTLEKDDQVTVYVQGASGWTNGDKFSLTFDNMEFGNMLVNSDFASENGWETSGEAAFGDGQASLSSADSGISQSFYVPKAGPYIAEAVLENADNAAISLNGESQTVSGSETVEVKLTDLQIGDKVTAKVSGKAVVKSFTVRFDLDALDNQAPKAADVKIGGAPEAGAVLSGGYRYEDPDGHAEAGSVYKWYQSDEKDGDYTVIEGEDSVSLELTEELRDKYIKFEVTPLDEYLGTGETVLSEPVGPVYRNVIPNGDFEEGTGEWKEMSGERVQGQVGVWTHAGWYRGNIPAGKTGYQLITVPETGYYDLSVYLREPKSGEAGRISVRDQAGNVIREAEAGGLSGDWNNYELTDIPLEKGSQVQVCFTAGSNTLYADDAVLKMQRGSELPPFANILSFATDPEAYEIGVSSVDHTVTLNYYYDTDLTAVTVTEMELSEGAKATVEVGDVLDLSKEDGVKITVTAKDGSEEAWTIKGVEAEKKVVVHSSNEYLEDTFNWAAQKQRQFVMTGQTGPINVSNNNYAGAEEAEYIPSYWAGYYDRTAFYARDFVHQATGGQIAGLEEENFNMFKAFAEQCTEERQWYTVWALNFDGSVYTLDYNNANSFVREVPSQFELVEKAYKQYLWSGDERYITDETLWNFYTNVMTNYVDTHDKYYDNGDIQVADEVGTGIFNGSCTYNERGRRIVESGDAIGSQYQATLAYAAMLEARGEKEAAEEWYQKAADLKAYFNEEWSVSDDMQSEYVCAIGPDGEKYSDFSKETSWFMPMKLITEPGERNDAYIDFILENLGDGIGTTSTAPGNLEAYTYIPDMLWQYNRSEDAWKWMKYITSIKDEPHERPIQGTNGDYPEISFTFVSHVIEGMMGVEPNAGENYVATVPRLPQEIPDVTADHIDIGDYELSLSHTGNTSSELTNTVGDDLIWEARFYGTYDYIKVNGQYVKAEHKLLSGEEISYVTVTVASGETAFAEAMPVEDAEAIEAAKAVEDMINAIGEVTADKREVIEAARAAYDALSNEAKALVPNLDVLEAAEERLEEIQTGEEPDPENPNPENPDPENPDSGNPDQEQPSDNDGKSNMDGSSDLDTDGKGNAKGGTAPKTGDTASVIPVLLGMTGGLGAAGAALAIRRKRQK